MSLLTKLGLLIFFPIHLGRQKGSFGNKKVIFVTE